MKKAFLVIVVIILLPSMVFCFDLAVGIKGGLNLGWMTGDDWEMSIDVEDDAGSADTANLRFGFSGGIFFTIGIIEYLAIQPEILFSTIGGSYGYTWSGVDVDGVQSASVFEIPIYLKLRLPLGPGHLFLLIGPDIVFILGDMTMKIEALGVDVEVDIEPDNSTIFGISGGLGYETPAGPGKISFEVKYTRILTETWEDWEEFSNIVALLVGYGFNL